MKRLEGKVAVITGTAGAQGRAAALRFSAEGAAVVGCDLDAERAEETVALVRDGGGDMTSLHPVDLSDEADIVRLMAHVRQQHGGLDVLYNNAATFVRGRTVDTLTRQEWEFSVANEVTLVFLTVQQALPLFRVRGGGSVINIASVAGMVGSGLPLNAQGNFVHAVCKGALIRLTECLALEVGPLGIRVNAISPGVVETDAVARFISRPGLRPVFEGASVLRRLGTAEDVVSAALFLASDESTFITGANLPVDGGYAISGGSGLPTPDVQALFSGAETPGAASVRGSAAATVGVS